MKQKLISKRRRRKRTLWIASIAVLVVVLIVALCGYYVRDNVAIGDHIPANCSAMLTVRDLQSRWMTLKGLPQWNYAVTNYSDEFPWLASADKMGDVKEWFLMNLIGQEVRLVACADQGSGNSPTLVVYTKISRVGKFADLIARLARRVRMESDQGVGIRHIDAGGAFYYTVLGRVLVGGQSREQVSAAATLSPTARLVEPAAFVRMRSGGEAPWATLYWNFETGAVTSKTAPFKALYAAMTVEQEGIKARFEVPFTTEFGARVQQLTGKMQPRTSRTTMRMPADIVAGMTVCGSAPIAEILQNVSEAFGAPQLRPDTWSSSLASRGGTVPGVCGSLFAEVVRQFANEGTIALTNVDTYEIVPTPEFLLFGDVAPGVEKKFLDKLVRATELASSGKQQLQRKTLKGVEMVYLDLPEGKSLQVCVAEIGGMLAATTSEYALDSFIDAVLGNKPSLKTTEPNLIKPEQGANLILVVNVQRLAEVSREMFDLLLEYDLIIDMNREEYDRGIAPWIGLVELVRSVGLSGFFGSDGLAGELVAPFSRTS